MISAIPYLAAAVGMYVIGRSSDQAGERNWYVAISAILAAVGFLISSRYSSSLPIALAGITVATVGVLSCLSISWTLPTAAHGVRPGSTTRERMDH